MDDVIYPKVAGKMLADLNDAAPAGRRFETYDDLAVAPPMGDPEGLCLNNLDAFKRVLGQKGRSYWPKTRGYNVPEAMARALQAIALRYGGPREFAQALLDYLAERGIRLPDDEELRRRTAGLPRMWEGSLSRDPWAGDLEAEDSFCRVIDLVAERCVREERQGAPMPAGVVSPLGAVMGLALGRGSRLALGPGADAAAPDDGLGPVCSGLPDDVASLAQDVLPAELVEALIGDGGMSDAELARSIVGPIWDPAWQAIALRYFTEDGGHRFVVGLVGRVQGVFDSYCDAELLFGRITALYQAVAAVPGHRAAWESYRVIRAYSMQRDVPRMFAAATLSTMVGMDRCGALAQVVEGRRG